MARATDPKDYTLRSTDGRWWQIDYDEMPANASTDFVVTDGIPDATAYPSAVELFRLVDGNATITKTRTKIEKVTHARGKISFPGKPTQMATTTFMDVLDPTILASIPSIGVDATESVRIRISDGTGLLPTGKALVYISTQANNEFVAAWYNADIWGDWTADFPADGSGIASMSITVEGLAVPSRAAGDQVGFIQKKTD